MFLKYAKANQNEKRIPLLYLILNGYDIKQVKTIEDAKEDKKYGQKLRIFYGITDELIDERKIEEELESIKTPIIYPPQTFELYVNCPTIHVFTPQIPENPLIIHDLGVISPEMVITRKCIVSTNPARNNGEIPNGQHGFMYFMDYVLKEELYVGNWHIIYKDKCFAVNYISMKEDKEIEEMLYMAIEINKTSTYKLVIYIIKKVCELTLDKFESQNFNDEIYELIG